ncbi:MAG: S8 family serine peptidase [Lachnospiraceae bacterium]|nr:S8 family serine peptidase [Lachnospiraceae bacterium]
MKWTYKILAMLMVCMLVFTSIPMCRVAAEEPKREVIKQENRKKLEHDENVNEKKRERKTDLIEIPVEQKTQVMEVTDLSSFTSAVENLTSDTLEKAKGLKTDEKNLWQNKCLIVQSAEGFDTKGAIHVIQGYAQMFVLFYETEEATKAAYEYLQTIPYLTVEPDVMISVAEENVIPKLTAKEREVSGNVDTQIKSDVTVAVIDSGYDTAGCGENRILSGVDFTGSDTIQDANGHGTAMANIILDNTKESVKIMPIKVADANGRSSSLKLYLALCYAIENGADIINISMSAYKPTDDGIVKKAIDEATGKGIAVVVAAGNNNEDTQNYVPANVENAIVVSAVNADKTLDSYSNHGTSVDFSANGSLDIRGMNNSVVTVSGTSVSAAITSAVMASIKTANAGISYADLLAELEKRAEDLGEPGKDTYFGAGLLSLESIEGKIEDKTDVNLPELLTCDWKNMSVEALNELISQTEEIYQKRFLDNLSETEKTELLGREDILYNHTHTAVVYDPKLKETDRFHGTLKEYLYSKFFDEYTIQAVKDTNGNWTDSNKFGQYGANQPCWAPSFSEDYCYVNTSADGTKATVRLKQSGGQPADKYTTTISATNAGAFDFSGMEIYGRFLGGDDNGHNTGTTPFHYSVFVKGIAVTKPTHAKVSKQSALIPGSKTYLAPGGFYKADAEAVKDKATGTTYATITDYTKKSLSTGSNDCASTKTTNVHLMIGEGDVKARNTKKNHQVFTLEFSVGYLVEPERWSNGEYVLATCSAPGIQKKYKDLTCSECFAVLDVKKSDEIVASQLAHSYGAQWIMGINNGIVNGVRYHQCNKIDVFCGKGTDINGQTWQKDFEYYQHIAYRYQNADGTYPAGYTDYVNGYYPYGAAVPAFYYDTTYFIDKSMGAYTSEMANDIKIDIPRKQYTVTYVSDMKGAQNMPAAETVFAGAEYKISSVQPLLTGHTLRGWTLHKDGTGEIFQAGSTMTVSDNVTLYAKWEKAVYTITLDNQGADKNKEGTIAVYQKYDTGYYSSADTKKQFQENKIQLPEKSVEDKTLLNHTRKQKFLGYYTKKNGNGHQMIKADGSLIANIAQAGKYKYFTADDTVYANWENMYAIQFVDNLSEKDVEILSKDVKGNIIENPVEVPAVIWKEKGKNITIDFAAIVINNDTFKDIYRLKGYSLTPEISSDEEIILSEDKKSYTFTSDEDVILYAQWDTGFMVTYIGSEQTEGIDYMDKVERITDSYTFNPNDKDLVALLPNTTADYFVKTVEKPTIDIATGEAADESGNPYMEDVPCRFRGWSMYREKVFQKEAKIYSMEYGSLDLHRIYLDAKEAAAHRNGSGLTVGFPSEMYGMYSALHLIKKLPADGKENFEKDKANIKGNPTEELHLPYINMYAVWDEFPQIAASDLYFTLEDAQSGCITEEYLLNMALATDEELKSTANPEGKLKNGIDVVKKTKFTLLDYQASDFTCAEAEMAMTITYCAIDSVGNTTTKKVTVYLADATGEKYETGNIRFISEKYINTLAEDSVWRTGEYAAKLAQVLANEKTGEEYTTVTPVQQAFGVESVKKPGSGTWNHAEQVWKFTHEEIVQAQNFLNTNGINGSSSEFLAAFAHCRIK